jgi:hypothetical protein
MVLLGTSYLLIYLMEETFCPSQDLVSADNSVVLSVYLVVCTSLSCIVKYFIK